MDDFQKSYTVKNRDQSITFNDISSEKIDENYSGHSAEEFVKYFSIDDDDIVRLDQSQIIRYEVKSVMNHVIDNILNQEKCQSQIKNPSNKRPLELNNEEYRLNKKVRFNIPNEEQLSLTSIFVSEAIDSNNRLKPYTKFLYNLGFDLCLQENPNENTNLSETQKQILIKHNEVFYRNQIYSCKYCSFKTNTIHVMDHHYRTPHTLSNSNDHNKKYRCVYCSFKTFRLPELRRHVERKHGHVLVAEPSLRRYLCSYCSYETDDKNHFTKHNSRCQIEQERARIANNLLQPLDVSKTNNHRQLNTITTKSTGKNKKKQTTKSHLSTSFSNDAKLLYNQEINDLIIIESDHDTSPFSRSSSSDEDFIVSSDEVSSSDDHNDDVHDHEYQTSTFRSKKPKKSTLSSTTSSMSQSFSMSSMATTNFSSLSKLLLLNGTPISSLASSSMNPTKTSLIPIQQKQTIGNDMYQMCNICRCYICKRDYMTHMKEKHSNQTTQPETLNSTPLTNLNNTANNLNTSTTCLSPALVVTKAIPQTPPKIFLLSTSTMNLQSIRLDMIKCPWCDTNFEHIDIMTGHLMRYHRMTLAVAQVVVAEQMKIQSASSSQLSQMFKQEIEQIQRQFTDKIYWKISQPKVYLHQLDNLSCFACKKNVDDIENHFISSHQIQLVTMNTMKQCCLCGLHCNKKTFSLFEHQLRTHSGVCYSSILKQFIRFDPPPPPTPRTILSKSNSQSISRSSNRPTLTTCTEKKFGCRKCDTSSHLFTFEELVEHLRSNHKLIVKLHRRCIICQQTYFKGKEYNQHCLEHLNEESPSIEIKRQYVKK
ncbi:unnamed protein product [Rotaria magnacalcarata]|uniref:C2H2-type domain-containing protein n=2 Tax=Rotaria magnacalcarata TaxID=392030 RepID=A0A816CS29_9BILA|nr:unnamed protein product [Rotaria magnacalcarata]CAF4137409.1 unnamed protein product [Rotaria magnacalcarata]